MISNHWVMRMTWQHLLFAHWPVPASALQKLVHPELEVESFDGTAWLSVVPFTMTGVAPRLFPSIPRFSNFAEINLRTYVQHKGHKGVWFFSLDATNPVAVAFARIVYKLPYFQAMIHTECQAGRMHYVACRSDCRGPMAHFDASYKGVGTPARSWPGSLTHFLTERYHLFSKSCSGQLWRGQVQHEPWSLQDAEADINANDMFRLVRLPEPTGSPILHYSRSLDVRASRPIRVA